MHFALILAAFAAASDIPMAAGIDASSKKSYSELIHSEIDGRGFDFDFPEPIVDPEPVVDPEPAGGSEPKGYDPGEVNPGSNQPNESIHVLSLPTEPTPRPTSDPETPTSVSPPKSTEEPEEPELPDPPDASGSQSSSPSSSSSLITESIPIVTVTQRQHSSLSISQTPMVGNSGLSTTGSSSAPVFTGAAQTVSPRPQILVFADNS